MTLGSRGSPEVEQACGTFDVVNRLGLHARAASKLVQLASRFPCEVHVSRDDQRANAKSVMGVCSFLFMLCGLIRTGVWAISATSGK